MREISTIGALGICWDTKAIEHMLDHVGMFLKPSAPELIEMFSWFPSCRLSSDNIDTRFFFQVVGPPKEK